MTRIRRYKYYKPRETVNSLKHTHENKIKAKRIPCVKWNGARWANVHIT